MTTINQSNGQGALFELVARGNKDVYFLKDSKDSVFPYDASYKSSAHHLAELKIVWPLLQPGSIVAVDDNRNGHGKGEQVAAHMAALGVPEIISGYVRAWKVPQ